MSATSIAGIMLVRNEDVFLRQAIANILEFCDELVILDHRSDDQTATIARTYEQANEHVAFHSIESPAQSHVYIEKFAGTNTWVFGVDGDEIYDPAGLRRLKYKLLRGEYDAWWQVFGNVLNCVELDLERMTGRGYLAPPCRSITKLFNFAAIESWNGDCPERLHGGVRIYREGYGDRSRLNLHDKTPWEEADLRCLHTCFLRRSSRDANSRRLRENIVELNSRRAQSALRRRLGGWKAALLGSRYKKVKYMRGDLVEKDIGSFIDKPVSKNQSIALDSSCN